MYGPPTVPSTGGGWLIGPLAGLAVGATVGSWLIVITSLLIVGLILFSLWRLRRGEMRVSRR